MAGDGRRWQESGGGDGRWYDVAAEWALGIVGPVVGKLPSNFQQHYFKLIYSNFYLNRLKYYILYLKIHIKSSRMWLYIF